MALLATLVVTAAAAARLLPLGAFVVADGCGVTVQTKANDNNSIPVLKMILNESRTIWLFLIIYLATCFDYTMKVIIRLFK